MGTRSTIMFVQQWTGKNNEIYQKPLVNIYQQYDGYINGVGYDLARWLLSKKICNGFNSETDKSYANGVGCLAAQFVRDFKNEIGGLYVTPMEDTENYNYKVIVDESKVGDLNYVSTITVTRFDDEEPIFVGTPSELLNFNEEEK